MLSGTLTLDLRNGIKDQGVNLLPPRELMHVVANSTMMNDFKRGYQGDQRVRMGYNSSPQKRASDFTHRTNPLNGNMATGQPAIGNSRNYSGKNPPRLHEASEPKRVGGNSNTIFPLNREGKEEFLKANYQSKINYTTIKPVLGNGTDKSSKEITLPQLGKGNPTRFRINQGRGEAVHHDNENMRPKERESVEITRQDELKEKSNTPNGIQAENQQNKVTYHHFSIFE